MVYSPLSLACIGSMGGWSCRVLAHSLMGGSVCPVWME
jgi:hypothetical protein